MFVELLLVGQVGVVVWFARLLVCLGYGFLAACDLVGCLRVGWVLVWLWLLVVGFVF